MISSPQNTQINPDMKDILPVHKAQVLTYMKLSAIKLGLLINFNVADLKEGIQRFIL